MLQSCLTLCEHFLGQRFRDPPVKSLQSCPTVWIMVLQAPLSVGFSRQELTFFFSSYLLPWNFNRTFMKWKSESVKSLSCVWLFATPQTVTYQAPLSMGFFQARILEWVAISFSRGSSKPRDWTWVSCIAGGFFTVWVTKEAPGHLCRLSISVPWAYSYFTIKTKFPPLPKNQLLVPRGQGGPHRRCVPSLLWRTSWTSCDLKTEPWWAVFLWPVWQTGKGSQLWNETYQGLHASSTLP